MIIIIFIKDKVIAKNTVKKSVCNYTILSRDTALKSKSWSIKLKVLNSSLFVCEDVVHDLSMSSD